VRALFAAPALSAAERAAYDEAVADTRGPMVVPATVLGVCLIASFAGWDWLRAHGTLGWAAQVRLGGSAAVLALLALMRWAGRVPFRVQTMGMYCAVYALQLAIGQALGPLAPMQLPALLITMFFSVLAFAAPRDALVNLPLAALSLPVVLPPQPQPADVAYVVSHFLTVAAIVWAATAALQRMAMQSFCYRLRLQHEASTDALTGLANRREFERALPREIERARRMKLALTLAIVDVDHFKRVNDTYGHDVGDEVLRAVAHALQARTRRSDVLARVGGEEFALLMLGTAPPGARVVLERLREGVQALRVPTSAGEVACTVSIGMTEWHGGDADSRLIYKRADDALYDAKAQGRNRVVVNAEPEAHEAALPA
jgi:diguanylate cyclase (GGDEF)-like protein